MSFYNQNLAYGGVQPAFGATQQPMPMQQMPMQQYPQQGYVNPNTSAYAMYQNYQEQARAQEMARQQALMRQQMQFQQQQKFQQPMMGMPQPQQMQPNFQQSFNQQQNMYQQPVTMYQQQPQSTNTISSWGNGGGVQGKYKPKTSSQPVQQYQQVQTPVTPQQVDIRVPDDVLNKISKLEDENLILKEKIEMLAKVIYSNMEHGFLIGKNESGHVQEEVKVQNGKLQYTLYGDGTTNSENVPTFQVSTHIPRRDTDGGVCFISDPCNPEHGTEINNIIGVGEKIAEDIFSNAINTTEGSIYKHSVRVGQTNQIGNNTTINEEVKKRIDEMVENSEDKLLTEEMVEKVTREVADDIEEFLKKFKQAPGIIEAAQFLDNSERSIKKDGFINGMLIPIEIVTYLKEELKSTYNDFVRINLGEKFDPLGKMCAENVIDADKGMTGKYEGFPRTQEQINAYTNGLKKIMIDFMFGLKLLKTNVLINEEDSTVNVIIGITSDMHVYSVCLDTVEEVKELAKDEVGMLIVAPESHKQVYGILNSIITRDLEMKSAIDELGYSQKHYIHNAVIRFANISNGTCVAYKAYRVIKGSQPIFVLKKIYQNF